MHYIEIEKDLLYQNDKVAENIKKNMDEHGIFVINMMSAPGAGKTTLLEALLPPLSGKYGVAVFEGDIQGSADADRLSMLDINVKQINTHSLCHLEASMIERSLADFDLHSIDLLVIENVGNLVCPADFFLGEDLTVMVVSVTEGHDKPCKYPVMFSKADIIILNKIDLIELTDFEREIFYNQVRGLNNDAEIIEASAVKGLNIPTLVKIFMSKIQQKKDNPHFHGRL